MGHRNKMRRRKTVFKIVNMNKAEDNGGKKGGYIQKEDE